MTGDVEVSIAHEFAAYLLGRDHALADEAGVDHQCDDMAGLDQATWFAHELWRIALQGMADTRPEGPDGRDIAPADEEATTDAPDQARRTERVIWIDANGHQTDNPDEAERGEIEVIHPDGSRENTLFEVEDALNRMTMVERWAADEADYAEHPRRGSHEPVPEPPHREGVLPGRRLDEGG